MIWNPDLTSFLLPAGLEQRGSFLKLLAVRPAELLSLLLFFPLQLAAIAAGAAA
ncbi:hypothetical protein GCM10010917_17620 [Paenibacillus physcomitrellae]|uniref:Uncharacterized protein n=1 Tax=Paenibacillus physcomitrellae TaxID=1619311 RepID=A0ABQ1FZG7_9BACL|nr:hypothetical protein GCM10010917_17620 [Paenibacillus physcomitrellae]